MWLQPRHSHPTGGRCSEQFGVQCPSWSEADQTKFLKRNPLRHDEQNYAVIDTQRALACRIAAGTFGNACCWCGLAARGVGGEANATVPRGAALAELTCEPYLAHSAAWQKLSKFCLV